MSFSITNALKWLIEGKTPNLNVLTANDYYDRLKLIAISLFEWDGLPESCNERFLENTLYTYGRAIFFKDETLDFLNMRCTPSGVLNVYEEPVSYQAVSSVYSKDLKREECVLIRNNYLERDTDMTVRLFASRLTEAERTIDVNIKSQKTPVIVTGAEKDMLTLKNIYKQYDGNEPVIFGGKNVSADTLRVLKTDAPFVTDKIQQYKTQIWNEALTFFGINNANSDKKERLITDEVNANNEVISINAQTMLLTRLEACELINKKYGLNVSVKMRSFEGQEQERQEVETEDGEIHG